jgi:hypothetical protein
MNGMCHLGRVALVLGVLAWGGSSIALAEYLGAVQSWRGVIADDELFKKVPTVIASQDQFEALWKAWRPGQPTPKVDFKKHLVFVFALPKRRLNGMNVEVREGGETFVTGISGAGGPKLEKGFSYIIGSYRREKIKSLGPDKTPLPGEK